MQTLNIYIVEDEPLIAETIKTILEEGNHKVLGYCDNVKSALFDIEELKPDLVLLDIMLAGELDGIDMSQHLQKRFNNLPFIFLTSLSDAETLKRVKKTNASGFIVKPFNENTLLSNIELAWFKSQQNIVDINLNSASNSFFIKNKGELIRVKQDDMLYLEAYDNYCNLYTKDKKHLISHTLKYIEEKLPSQKFLRVHRSYIINLNKIDSLHDGYAFIDANKIPVSKSHKDQLYNRLNLL